MFVAWLQMVTFVNFHFSVTIISLGYCYIHLDSIFTAEHVLHAWSRIDTFCQEIIYIHDFELYDVSMTCCCNLTQYQYLTVLKPWSPFEFTMTS
jgi:hypothetical protein